MSKKPQAMTPRERLLSAFRPIDPGDVIRELERENFRLLKGRCSDVEAVARDQARQAGTGKPRGSRWPQLDDDIRAVLVENIETSAKEIFRSLPASFEDCEKSYYVDEDVIIDKTTNRSLGISGFETRVSNIKQTIKNSR